MVLLTIVQQYSSTVQYSSASTVQYTYTVPKVIDYPRYNMKRSGENVIVRGIFHVLSCLTLHFMLYRGNLDKFLDIVGPGAAPKRAAPACNIMFVSSFK